MITYSQLADLLNELQAEYRERGTFEPEEQLDYVRENIQRMAAKEVLGYSLLEWEAKSIVFDLGCAAAWRYEVPPSGRKGGGKNGNRSFKSVYRVSNLQGQAGAHIMIVPALWPEHWMTGLREMLTAALPTIAPHQVEGTLPDAPALFMPELAPSSCGLWAAAAAALIYHMRTESHELRRCPARKGRKRSDGRYNVCGLFHAPGSGEGRHSEYCSKTCRERHNKARAVGTFRVFDGIPFGMRLETLARDAKRQSPPDYPHRND